MFFSDSNRKLLCFLVIWRTTQQQEIDFIEDSFDSIKAFEFKWSERAKFKIPKTFTRAYPDASIAKISRKNYENILL